MIDQEGTEALKEVEFYNSTTVGHLPPFGFAFEKEHRLKCTVVKINILVQKALFIFLMLVQKSKHTIFCLSFFIANTIQVC